MTDFLGVPDVIWSGVVASCIAFGGVWLSNRSNTDRLVKQLAHDEREKTRQRKADLRSEVYLDFATEYSAASAHIGKLPDVDIASTNPAVGIQPFLAVAAKVQLICSSESADMISPAIAAFMALFTRASVKALSIQNIAAQISYLNSAYDRSQNEINRLLSAMKDFNESQKPDHAAFRVLSRAFEREQATSKEMADKRSDLWRSKNELHVAYLRFVVAELTPVIDLIVPATVALRRELEVDEPGEASEYQARKRANTMKSEVQSVLDEFVNAIKAQDKAEV